MLLRSSARASAPLGMLLASRAGVLIAAAGLVAMGLGAAPATASATHPARRPPAPPLPLSTQRLVGQPQAAKPLPGVRQACPQAQQAGEMQCMTLIRTDTRHYRGVVPDQTPSGYGPSQLQSAYNLTSSSGTGGTGETVAVVSAYDDPDAASDLAVYRAQFGLSACNSSTGAGCVTKENEHGQATPLPPVQPNGGINWEQTESVDLDMVSAICPNCHILLIETSTNQIPDLGAGENTAASSGAAFVANSWNGGEFGNEDSNDSYFNHPGVAITVASGQNLNGGNGYGTTWPSSSQFVTSVGGTTLTQDTGVPRGWTETVWKGTGSGCSLAEAKPSWQTEDDTSPNGCLNRTENDVAAVADPATGVAMYDTYGTGSNGWAEAGGTSVAAPIIAAVYALAGPPSAGTYPASYPYQSGHAADLYDVTSGSNGSCETNRQYLCNGETGYDGPTGLGTPDGTAAFTNSSNVNIVTLTDPGTQDLETSTAVFVAMQGNDTAGLALKYSATGLPPGLKMGPASGRITGTLSSTTGVYTVTVKAKDVTGAVGTVTFTIAVMQSLATDYFGVSGPVDLDLDSKCLDDKDGSTKPGAVVDEYHCNGGVNQNWEFEPDGNPGAGGTFVHKSMCLDLKGGSLDPNTPIVLEPCDGASTQQWQFTGAAGQIYSTYASQCLTDPDGDTHNSAQLLVSGCIGAPYQAWIPPASPIQSGVKGMCVDDNGDKTANGNKIQVWGCNGSAAQKWTEEPDQTLRLGGKCLSVTGNTLLDGAVVLLESCGTTSNQQWVVGPTGELINVNSGRCLDDPGNSTTEGTALVQEDCYGQPGEIWALT
jgi:hypothetical protein